MEISELQADLAAFADEEEEVVIDPDGSFLLVRNGKELSGRLVVQLDGTVRVRRGGVETPYRQFLMNDLANMQLFAERLVARRPPVEAFVDGDVEVFRAASARFSGPALEKLKAECEDVPTFSARVSFITADAGHGKTALLRQFQFDQAKAFINGDADYLFWHVDLQGRQLLRLSEALMGDLGDLRITGLWMPTIVRLMRSRALILGIDGFDELAAEQGSTDALGALAALVTQLGGHGCVVAAARRSFFDTDDYLRRAGVLGKVITTPCEFNQLSLLPWNRQNGISYLQSRMSEIEHEETPEATYDRILSELGHDSDHPMLTRPFLLAQIVKALIVFGVAPAEFIRTADQELSGVATVVQAFVRREVSEKWKSRESGEPYLTEIQHMQFLSDVAEEMYRSQKDRLSLDVIETIAVLLLDQWQIDAARRPQIIEMVRMHVLLVPPDGEGQSRAFDHPEFRDYFIAYALRGHLEKVMDGSSANAVAQLLSLAQLSDSTARYVCAMVNRTEIRVKSVLQSIEDVLSSEWKPTFLQTNIGTLIPFMLSGVEPDNVLNFAGRAVYSSLVFEHGTLRNCVIQNASFVNVSLVGIDWRNVTLVDCALGELTFDASSSFDGVTFQNCKIDGMRLRSFDEEEWEYAPGRMASRLSEMGISVSDDDAESAVDATVISDTPLVRLLRRFLRSFNRTTVITDEQIKNRFRQEHSSVFDRLVPLLEEYEILVKGKWRGAGQGRVWVINERLEDVLAAEENVGKASLTSFWASLRQAG